jgi:Family of unknown function (DUF6522)
MTRQPALRMLDARQPNRFENAVNIDRSDSGTAIARDLPHPPDIEVDAALVASALGLAPAEFQALMRNGRIRTLCERGIGEDAGRYRLSFYHLKRRFRLITDAQGNVLSRLS